MAKKPDFFDPDHFFWRGISRASDLVLLSVCFFFSAALILTLPAALVALYDAVARCVSGDEGHPCRRFFRTLKNELPRSIALALIWGILAAVLSLSYHLLYSQAMTDTSLGIYATLYYFSLFIPLAVFCWLVPLESRYVYKFGQLHRMAMFVCFNHLPATLAVTALAAGSIWLALRMPILMVLIPGFCTYGQTFFTEPVLKKYMPE